MRLGLGKCCGNGVEEVSRTVAVGRRDGPGLAEAESPELVYLVLAIGRVHLVDDEEDGRLGSLEEACDLLITRSDPGGPIDQHDDHVRLTGRDQRLCGDRLGERVVLGRLDTAGIDEHELPAVPVAAMIRTVTGDASCFMHDSLTGLSDPVDEGRLAHVRAADDRHDR